MKMKSLNTGDGRGFLFLEYIKRNKLIGIKSKRFKISKHMIFSLFIFIFLLQVDLNKSICCFRQYNSNEITIKIKGTGPQYVLNAEYEKCPNFIYLNDEPTNILGTDCHVVNMPEENDELNTIKLIWNEKATTCYNMFSHMADNLIEVDLSKFDTSSVVTMHGMFWHCHSV